MPTDLFLVALACGTLAACSLAPDYKVPETPVPATFKESGIWTAGTPQDTLPRGPWWRLYGDATLNDRRGLRNAPHDESSNRHRYRGGNGASWGPAKRDAGQGRAEENGGQQQCAGDAKAGRA